MRLNGHQVAVWAGIASFFGSLLTIELIDVFNPANLIKLAGSLLVAGITGLAVYARQRLDDAKEEKRSQ